MCVWGGDMSKAQTAGIPLSCPYESGWLGLGIAVEMERSECICDTFLW